MMKGRRLLIDAEGEGKEAGLALSALQRHQFLL
jgi:hypothetical protein